MTLQRKKSDDEVESQVRQHNPELWLALSNIYEENIHILPISEEEQHLARRWNLTHAPSMWYLLRDELTILGDTQAEISSAFLEILTNERLTNNWEYVFRESIVELRNFIYRYPMLIWLLYHGNTIASNNVSVVLISLGILDYHGITIRDVSYELLDALRDAKTATALKDAMRYNVVHLKFTTRINIQNVYGRVWWFLVNDAFTTPAAVEWLLKFMWYWPHISALLVRELLARGIITPETPTRINSKTYIFSQVIYLFVIRNVDVVKSVLIDTRFDIDDIGCDVFIDNLECNDDALGGFELLLKDGRIFSRIDTHIVSRLLYRYALQCDASFMRIILNNSLYNRLNMFTFSIGSRFDIINITNSESLRLMLNSPEFVVRDPEQRIMAIRYFYKDYCLVNATELFPILYEYFKPLYSTLVDIIRYKSHDKTYHDGIEYIIKHGFEGKSDNRALINIIAPEYLEEQILLSDDPNALWRTTVQYKVLDVTSEGIKGLYYSLIDENRYTIIGDKIFRKAIGDDATEMWYKLLASNNVGAIDSWYTRIVMDD